MKLMKKKNKKLKRIAKLRKIERKNTEIPKKTGKRLVTFDDDVK